MQYMLVLSLLMCLVVFTTYCSLDPFLIIIILCVENKQMHAARYIMISLHHKIILKLPIFFHQVSSIHDVIETSHSLAELEIISDNIYADIKHRQELASAAEAKAADSGGDQGSSAEEDEEADRSTPASRLSKHRKSIAELTRTRNQVQARSEVVAQGLNAVKSQQQVQVQMLPFETILSGSTFACAWSTATLCNFSLRFAIPFSLIVCACACVSDQI